jgi:glycosyltransferase involved in cell wall biosynthesis
MGVLIFNVIEEGKLGGPQVRMVRVAAALAGRVDTLVVMPLANSVPFREACEALHVDYRALPLTRMTKEWRVALGYLLFSPLEVFRLARLVRRSKADLVHVSGGSWQVKGVIAARLARVPCVWHLNDTMMPGFIRKMFRMLSGSASGYIFASERTQAYYAGLVDARKPCFVVPAPVDTKEFDPALAIDGDEDLLQRWAGKVVVGVTANVNRVKGLETFIRVAGRLNARFEPEKLVFACVGPVYANQRGYHEKLLALCGELGVANMEFVGARSDVRPLLKRFDVYLCTSVAESSPISVWEAMAMARPVVSTDVGDVPLYVKDGESGFVITVGDDAALAQKVGLLIDDAGLRARLGGNARRIAVDKLDLAICADRHLAAYRALLGER